MKKRFISLCLALVLLCTFFAPMTVHAKTTFPTYTVLVLDTSGKHQFYSNNSLIYTADSALSEVKTAAGNFSDALLRVNDNHYVAVVAYKGSATTVSGFTQDRDLVQRAIKNISNSGDESVNVTSGLDRAHQLLSAVKDNNAVKNVIVFTTGLSNTGSSSSSGIYDSSTPGSNWYNRSTKIKLYCYANSAIKSAEVLHKYANVYSVGLFENWDDMPSAGQEIVTFFKMFTQDLANPRENYNPVYNKNDLDYAFAEICNDIIDNPFNDVNYQKYYFDAVFWAGEEGITTGTSLNSFDPNEICTREQMVTFLWRKTGKPAPQDTDTAFTDLQPGSFSYKAILWAEEQGITNGTSPTTFSPERTVTREQVVTFLWRVDGKPQPGTDVCKFRDVTPGTFSYPAILWAQEENITKGTSATTFSPKDPCTRGQIITFMYRYYVEE